MIQASELVSLFRKALEEKWGYIYGQSGAVWTEAKQKAATREQTVKYGRKWIGHNVADCSGLFSWAFRCLGGYMYHGTNTMWKKYMAARGALTDGKRTDGRDLKPGTAVFKAKGTNYFHVGLYVGNGTVIEAKGTAYGVVTSAVTAWHAWGEMQGVDYGDGTVTDRTLRLTRPYMRGEDVHALQATLNRLGFPCGPEDGIYGNKTRSAVRAFQASKGLMVDGVVGVKTWGAFKEKDDI